MNVELTQDYFSLFGLTASFELDLDGLQNLYQRLQNVIHPDRHVQASDSLRRDILQKSAYLNEAYQTLKNPLSRGFYLLKLNGYDDHQEHTSTLSADFLAEQIEIRERLSSIRTQDSPLKQLKSFEGDLDKRISTLYGLIKQSFKQGEFEQARENLLKQQFLQKVYQQCQEMELMMLEEED